MMVEICLDPDCSRIARQDDNKPKQYCMKHYPDDSNGKDMGDNQ